MDAAAAIWQSSVPILLAALAGSLAGRAGIWHLGLGGLISIGAMVSVVVSAATGSWGLGVLAATFGAVLASLVMWVAIVPLRANAIIVGIGINLLGHGGTILAVVALYGAEGSIRSASGIWRPLTDVGGQVAQLSVVALVAPLFVVGVWWLCCRTRWGLQVLATGSHPFAARSAGIDTGRIKLVVLVLGGVLCGLAGSELALGTLGSFNPGMEAGRGLIAFAAVILGASHPIAASGAALFFGAVSYFGVWAQLNLQGTVPVELLLMLPYLVTIVAVVVSGRLSLPGSDSGRTDFTRDP